VPLRVVALLACLTAVLAGCRGDGESSGGEAALLGRAGFREAVASELRKADSEASEGQGLEVQVQDGPNRIDLALAEPFEEYRREPERREEIVAGLVREARRRLAEGLGGLSFAEARDSLMPLLKPRFALRTLAEAPAQTPFAADLAVIYAVDREDDFTVVTLADVARWGKPLPELHELALANLTRRTNAEERLLCEPLEGNELCGWASGDGYDATRMIAPELRRQIEEVYDGPAVYAVPMEDVFVALSYGIATRGNTEELLRARVQRDFSMADTPVSPELFVERDGKLVVFAA
jgi:uncharacterized protein YtpQ (UPF0354 family)